MKKLKIIDLFSGGGGFSYAAEKLVGGYETIQFVENEPYCQKVLKKHWPLVPIHDDIKTYKPEPYSADVVCGGFPCQDLSVAGKGRGITKETRSGLFYELMRVVCVVRPKYIVLENVAAILNNGLGIVLGELAKAGFDCEWACIPASALGACHQRDRWWLVAYPNNNGSFATEKSRSIEKTDGGAEERKNQTSQSERSGESTNSGAVQFNAPNTNKKGLQRETSKGIQRKGLWPQPTRFCNPNWKEYGVEPAICRNNDGTAPELFTNQANRLKLLGNGLVPQCAAIPLQRVLDLENES